MVTVQNDRVVVQYSNGVRIKELTYASGKRWIVEEWCPRHKAHLEHYPDGSHEPFVTFKDAVDYAQSIEVETVISS